MSTSVAVSGSASPGGGASPSAPSLSSDFKAAVSNSSTSAAGGLAVHGDQIDTGRYVITGSNSYTRPMDGGRADDGMVQVFDKTNQSYVDVFGDPHVYTSAGDRANFQADGLVLNLADGTQIQFKPTAEVGGVSHVDSIAVTKNGQTVVQSGYYSADGRAKVSTGPVTQGGPSTAQGFNDTRDTVLSVGSAGSLGTLVNTMGMQLSSKGYEDSLDGMGGGFKAFADTSGTDAMKAYSSALADNAGKGGGPNAADEPRQAGGTIPAAAKEVSTVPAATGDLASLLQQLIAVLQPKAAGAAATPVAPAAVKGDATVAPLQNQAPQAGGDDIAALIQRVVGLLTGQLSDPKTTPAEAALIKQIIPLLQAQGGQGGAAGETELLTALAASLGAPAPATGAVASTSLKADAKAPATPAVPASLDPSRGISGGEIDAMLAEANGTGPHVDFGAYDRAADNFIQQQNSPASTGQA